ncbi:hypothetical protein FML17_04835 [Klebsiella michiganensis]|uniref:hypothetical protein n=1 Tax=Klebsiella michiganensis TaxID=1134687 RepID=UPI003C12C011|nr:hypothetical protein [Klebsiella michiganensis]
MNIETVNELIQSLESAGELSIKERKYLELAKAYQQLAADNARYSMSAGHADQRMAESRAVRSALGFKPDADDVSPSDLVEAINQIVAELCVIRTAHPQPLGPAMDAAIDAFNADEMPETGMLNAYFILRESIRIKTPATDRIVVGIKADAAAPLVSALKVIANSEQHNGDTVVCDFDTLISVAAGALRDYYAKQLREGVDK